REFELFRRRFAITVVEDYYHLIGQKQRVANARNNADVLGFDARRAAALFDVDRSTKIDKLRADQAWLAANNALIDEEQSYKLLLDRFKTNTLGLPTSRELSIPDDATPSFTPVALEVSAAVASALELRLDLKTAQDRVEDAERALSHAKNGLW